MNSTFIPLAFIKGKGNLLNIFDFYSMALAAGLGSALLVIFACWCTFVFLYFKQYRLVKVLTKMKYKLSDDNITMENPGADDTSSMKSVDLFGV